MSNDMLNKLLDILAGKIGQLEINNHSLQLVVEQQQKEIEELKSRLNNEGEK